MTVCVPLANTCEHCDNFRSDTGFLPILAAQRTDAEARGWDAEVARHARVIASIEGHLRRLKHQVDPPSLLDTPTRAGSSRSTSRFFSVRY